METLIKTIDKDPHDEQGFSMRPMLWDRYEYLKSIRHSISPIYIQDTFNINKKEVKHNR